MICRFDDFISTLSQERQSLQDTSRSFPGGREAPSLNSFSPIGHIALAKSNVDANSLKLNLPENDVCWIKTLYIAHALQGEGIGRAAMDIIEGMAAEAPLNAKTLALDTVFREDQLKEEWFLSQGQSPRKVSSPNIIQDESYRNLSPRLQIRTGMPEEDTK
ncbi:hypothetical protein NW762_012806 [Fusarium torreyae]|uniref:N-acetyltransferase domain-containing protein n=1 Tax=Fusarium torreyae TaxID=1237075 RepID=A0A9W8RPZ2_9HYPO|nr:hypothetical protein NW762_012806 [Fusarium torreyae]